MWSKGPRSPRSSTRSSSGELWTDIAPGVRSAAASVIMTNNIQVMFLTFAGGITAGLLTAWVLALQRYAPRRYLWPARRCTASAAAWREFVVAHGVIELSVIFLAGGCGLYIGDGLLRPGLLSRKDALVERTRLGVQAILGCVPLLVVAGLIEGFLSPSAAALVA